MRSASLIVASLFTVVGACTMRGAGDPEAAAASLRDADSRYSQAILGRDRAVLVAFYADDAASYPPAEATVTTLEGIVDMADAFWADPAFAASFKLVVIEVSDDGSMGYTLNALDLVATGPDGNPHPERMRDFHVWRKQADGSWKIAIDIWNSEAASAATSAAGAATAAIAATWSGFESAWLKGDVPTATSGFFTTDAINVVPEAAETRGRAAIDASFADFFTTAKVTALERTTEEVEVSGDLAYERGTFKQTVAPSGGAPQTQHSRYLAIWKRQPDGTWRCHRFVFNNAPRPV
jgi:uncharacterized protein (TIGR02246 family)